MFIVPIELSKVKQEYFKHKDNPLLQWMMFLLNPESEEVSEIMETNNEIKTVVYELQQMSEEEINMKLAELREKAIRDEHAILDTGLRMGREEGFKVGVSEGLKRGLEQGLEQGLAHEKEGKLKSAKKLLDLNITIEQVSEIIGLSIEEIQSIKNRAI